MKRFVYIRVAQEGRRENAAVQFVRFFIDAGAAAKAMAEDITDCYYCWGSCTKMDKHEGMSYDMYVEEIVASLKIDGREIEYNIWHSPTGNRVLLSLKELEIN